MKFLGDMGVSQTVIQNLRFLGYDAIHLRDEGLQRLPDPQIIEKAKQENRIILTFDLDFADLLAVGRESLPSVIIFRLQNATPSSVSPRLLAVINECSQLLESGAILTVETARYRIRQLPII